MAHICGGAGQLQLVPGSDPKIPELIVKLQIQSQILIVL